MSSDSQAAILRQWALDAQTATNAANWSGTSYNATKDATLKLTIQRLGQFMNAAAEHLDHFGYYP